jgi:outer membrane protein assembly factor BamB
MDPANPAPEGSDAPPPPRAPRGNILRAGLIFPPLGLVRLWRRPQTATWRKVLGTVGLVLYSVVYCGLVTGLLVWLKVLELEFKGGFGPSLVFKKAVPDFDALDESRSRQQKPPAPAGLGVAWPKPYWTAFRGPRGDAVYDEQPIRAQWPQEGPPRLWKQPVGGGYASFVVADGRAFTIEQRREQETVVAYDLANGRELWSHSYPARFTEWMGGEGPRATPCWNQGRLYSLGATGEFCCLEAATGRLLWQKNLFQDNRANNLRYGLAASPLAVDDKVIVLAGQSAQGGAVVAYDSMTGNKLWGVLDDKTAYVSPLLVTLAGCRQLLVVTARRVVGLTAEEGRLLWEFPWRVEYDNSIAAPILVSSNRFVVSAGYGAGCALVEVAHGNSGFQARALWRNKNLKNKFNGSVFCEDYLYGLDEGVLACLDARTGERRWREGRYGYGQLLLASGQVVVLGGEGELALVKASPEGHQPVASIQALKGKTWNVPTLAHGRLLVRNAVEMACYDLRVR